MEQIHFDLDLDARGLKCPMPVVKARKQIKELEPGQVLRIVSTDRGSVKDFQGWVKVAPDLELLAQTDATENDREIYSHYIRKAS